MFSLLKYIASIFLMVTTYFNNFAQNDNLTPSGKKSVAQKQSVEFVTKPEEPTTNPLEQNQNNNNRIEKRHGLSSSPAPKKSQLQSHPNLLVPNNDGYSPSTENNNAGNQPNYPAPKKSQSTNARENSVNVNDTSKKK